MQLWFPTFVSLTLPHFRRNYLIYHEFVLYSGRDTDIYIYLVFSPFISRSTSRLIFTRAFVIFRSTYVFTLQVIFIDHKLVFPIQFQTFLMAQSNTSWMRQQFWILNTWDKYFKMPVFWDFLLHRFIEAG